MLGGACILDMEDLRNSIAKTTAESVEGDAGKFGEAEQLLLDEARQRFDFEQKMAASLHSKSTLFLTLTGVFGAFLTACIGRLLDHMASTFLELCALVVLLVALGFLTVVAILLGRSSLSRSYQVIATPGHWVKHLTNLRQALAGAPNREGDTFGRLRHDILDAWVEAAHACWVANEVKTSVLVRVSGLLSIAVSITFVGILLLVVQRVFH